LSQSFLYQVAAILPLARHVSSLTLTARAYSEVMPYQAGQYLSVIHPDGTASPLSMATAPRADGQIELHLSHAPANQAAQAILAMAKNDGVLTLQGPFGVCTLARFSLTRPLIFFVRGTGFAPAKALLEALAGQPDCPPLHLYWGVANADDFYGLQWIRQWETQFADFQFTPKVSRSADLHQLHHAVLHDYPDLAGVEIYASGGMDMVLSALAVFQQHGLVRERFFSDMTEST
jgi:CDP-4-dehydro-6-deoxyglucose reductase